jgi:imidazolonepropionase-like amidohydrolase
MLILSNVKRVYDGTAADRSAVRERVDVLIDGGRIHDVRPHHADHGAAATAPRVDASGWVVTPGLIDCHSHVTTLGLTAEDMARMEGQGVLLWVEKILYKTLVEGGVTTLRDVGGATHFMKRLVDEGTVIGPRMKIAICMLSTTGGHADFRGPDRCHGDISKLWGPIPGRPPSIVDGPWECRKRVREIAACGADLIKICTSPGVASPSDKLEHQDFGPEEVEAICKEAEARGLRVAAHAHSECGIELAIRHGVHDIQHISFMDERLVEMAHARGCTVTPTSWVLQELARARGLSAFVMEKVKQVCEVHSRAVAHARKGGLKVLAGTDPVLPRMHGRNYMELVALTQDGLTSYEAWYAATGLAAREIGQPDTGTLVPGQRADLLVCRQDVIEDPLRFEDGALVEVVKDGVAYRGAITELPQRTFGDTAAGV